MTKPTKRTKKRPDLNDKLMAGTLPADSFLDAVLMNDKARADDEKIRRLRARADELIRSELKTIGRQP